MLIVRLSDSRARACVCVCVWGDWQLARVRVALKPCAPCQGCTGTFFRIDELPVFLMKSSVTEQKNPTHKHTHTENTKRGMNCGEERYHVYLQSNRVLMWCAGTFITRILKKKPEKHSCLFCSWHLNLICKVIRFQISLHLYYFFFVFHFFWFDPCQIPSQIRPIVWVVRKAGYFFKGNSLYKVTLMKCFHK